MASLPVHIIFRDSFHMFCQIVMPFSHSNGIIAASEENKKN